MRLAKGLKSSLEAFFDLNGERTMHSICLCFYQRKARKFAVNSKKALFEALSQRSAP